MKYRAVHVFVMKWLKKTKPQVLRAALAHPQLLGSLLPAPLQVLSPAAAWRGTCLAKVLAVRKMLQPYV